MAIIESGVTTDLLTIDPVMKAARTTSRPFEYGTGGFYQLAKRTGTLPATLAANGELLQFRWTSASLLAVILEIKMHFQVLTAFTAHQEVSFEANRVNTFSAAGTGGGGSLSQTSSPAPAMRLSRSASYSASSLTIPPRAALIRRADFFISFNFSWPIRFAFGTCTTMCSAARSVRTGSCHNSATVAGSSWFSLTGHPGGRTELNRTDSGPYRASKCFLKSS